MKDPKGLKQFHRSAQNLLELPTGHADGPFYVPTCLGYYTVTQPNTNPGVAMKVFCRYD